MTHHAFFENLRSETGVLHNELEQLPLSRALVSATISANEYSEYLLRMHQIMRDVEDNIFPVVKDVVPDIEERKKINLLKDDIDFLNAPLPSEKKLPVTGSGKMLTDPFSLGILYVTEGSTLGGRFIIKNIQTVLGLNEKAGASYFAGYGEATGSRWKKLLTVIENYEAQHQAADKIIEGAKFAFTSIYNHMK